MRTTVLLVLAALALAAPPAAAHTINVGRFNVTSIGDFRPSRNASIPAAERVFGPASSRRDVGGTACRVRWRRLRLEILFTSFDSPGPSRCRGTLGKAQSFKARGKRFRTWHGLRVGQRERAVRRRHPAATRHGRSWWLSSAVNPIGEPVESPVLEATIGPRGRVRALRGWIGSAGD
jgi:hypothetical protein